VNAGNVQDRNIAIVWDFDGTLTPHDSTSQTVKIIGGDEAQFWHDIHVINGRTKHARQFDEWERILSSDAPTWMWSLARLAHASEIILTKSYFETIAHRPEFSLFTNACTLLARMRDLEGTAKYKRHGIQIHHFVVTAGLAELIAEILKFNQTSVSKVWGCRFRGVFEQEREVGMSVPVFCMDETMKTRAIFEIAKGIWLPDSELHVNDRVASKDLWCPFQNIIYVGDGPTDIPALSVVRDRGGSGIVVYDESKPKDLVRKRLEKMSAHTRCDCIVPARFGKEDKLYQTINRQCERIADRYRVQDFCTT